MKTLNGTILMLIIAVGAMAQTSTEIYLFDLDAKKNSVSISNPKNITNHKGYDNQPSFHPTAPMIYFSSFNDDGRSDIRAYNYEDGTTKMVTETQEREYSPTVTPDREHLSCIIQRDNNAQDLGKYHIDGGTADVIIDNMIVGYHAWADNSHLVLFVLGTPNTLHYLQLPTKKDTVLAENVGRSLHRIPGQPAISFVHKIADNDWQIKKFDNYAMTISTLAKTLPGREDLCWLPDGKMLMSDGTSLFFMKSGQKSDWIKVETAALSGLKGITRMAVGGNGKKLAVVVAED